MTKQSLLLLWRLLISCAQVLSVIFAGIKKLASLNSKSSYSKSLTERTMSWSHSMSSKSETRKFDKLFAEEGQGLPVTFLRVLAQRESASNPSEQSGPAWGLLQVGIDSRAGNVLQSYNARHGTSLLPVDMLDPRLNVRVASDLLARIVEMYARAGVKEDWTNGNFVGLVVAGWNAGYSHKAGTLRVIACLQRKGIPITLAAVYRNAEACGATRHLSNPRKQKWQRTVVASYLSEAGEGPARSKRESEWLPLLMLAFVLMR